MSELSRDLPSEVPSDSPRVLVLRTAGTNCEVETSYAFELAGATVETHHVKRLLDGQVRLEDYEILAFPGGFSYGDDLGAGTVLANELRTRLSGPLAEFVESGRFVIGICNGFQVLVRLGLLPGWEGDPAAALVENTSSKFEDRWVHLKVETDRCPFLAGGSGDTMYLPVAHKEGRFVLRDEEMLARLRDEGQVALRYVTADGDRADYPANPNGSIDGIAGITNARGNVLGLMPHPERHLRLMHSPSWTRQVDEGGWPDDEERAGDGFSFFEGAVRAARELAACRRESI